MSVSYADNIQFFKTGFDAIEIQQRMQADLVSASKWFETNAMCLNVSKCHTMRLGEGAYNLLLYLDGKSIEICHSMKLLGVTIDNDLNTTNMCLSLFAMSLTTASVKAP